MDHNSPSSFDTHMLSALEEARNALAAREVPVGCTFVCGRTGQVLATGRNRMTERCNATSHAELLAASYVLASSPTPEIGRARLRECTLYVTVEPCVMCAAAMLSLGVKRIVFGCFNENFGGCGTVLNVHRGVAECLGGGGSPLSSLPNLSDKTLLSTEMKPIETKGESQLNKTVTMTSTTLSSSSSSKSIPQSLEVVGGIREKEAIDLLRAFYRAPNPKAPKNISRSSTQDFMAGGSVH
jgi:tRNA(Arg) A34 adenosine deaminase TadA